VKPKLRRQLHRGKQKILRRLAPLIGGTEPRQHGTPEFHGPQPTYEVAERSAAVSCGGLGAIHRMVRRIGLPQLLDFTARYSEACSSLSRLRPRAQHRLQPALRRSCAR
jgi:hypothetical protein